MILTNQSYPQSLQSAFSSQRCSLERSVPQWGVSLVQYIDITAATELGEWALGLGHKKILFCVSVYICVYICVYVQACACVCVCECLCMHMHSMCINVCTCLYVWARGRYQASSTLLFEAGSLCDWLSWLASRLWGVSCLSCLQCSIGGHLV